MNKRTLVKIVVEENSFSLKTISRNFHSPHRFYILKEKLERLEKERWLIVRDINSFAVLYLKKEGDVEICEIELTWLRDSGDDVYTGRRETVRLPYQNLRNILAEGTSQSLLSVPIARKPKIEFRSRENLRKVVGNPIIRGKLGRFIDRNLNWVDHKLFVLTDDFLPYSFLFTSYTEQGCSICGGIILHNQGDLATAHYSMHT